MGVESRAVGDLKKDITLDNTLSAKEMQAMKDALGKDKDAVLQATKEDLSGFILNEYSQATKNALSKAGIPVDQGIKIFQQAAGVAVDGKYGKNTFRAVVEYQSANHLLVDGIIGAQTLKAARGIKIQEDSRQEVPQNRETEKKTRNIFSILFGGNKAGESRDTGKETYPQLDNTKAIESLKRLSPSERGKIARQLKVRNNLAQIVEAIAKFQKVSGLQVDGILGPNTKRALIESKDLPYSTPMSKADIRKMNKGLDDSEALGGIEKLKGRWKTIYKEFYLTLNSREKKEVLSGRYPVTLCDSRNQRAIYISRGNVKKEFSVIYGYGGFANGSVNVKGATPRKVVSRFNGANIAKSEYGYAANNPKKSPTVLGAAILSPEGAAGGGKWFHGVSDARMQSMRNGTAGCVGMSVQNARLIARDVVKCGKGFGYVS